MHNILNRRRSTDIARSFQVRQRDCGMTETDRLLYRSKF